MSFADLTGQLAVVTGASSGIGREIALEFARAGADLLLHCRQSVDAAQAVRDEIEHLGRSASLLTADLESLADVHRFANEAWQNRPVQIWVNNAGVDLLTGPNSQLDYLAKLQKLLDIDVRGTAALCHVVGKRMQQAGQGVILNIGWDQADRGMEGDSGELFATAKNAIMGLTRSLAVSLAPQVRVHCIAPGWIRTAWGETAPAVWQERVLRETPLRRWGEPRDIAAVARFLASREAAYLTGQVINVNGGAVR